MCHLLCAIFLSYPVEHAAAAIVVEVHINIRQRDTVRIQEAFKQQVILNRVNLGNAQAICHGTASCRATSRPYRHVQFVACSGYVILDNQEVARETHRFHHMKFETQTIVNVGWHWVSITFPCTRIGQFFQIIGLQFYAVKAVIAT